MPHSCHFALDCSNVSGYSTGPTPNRDGVAGTADDLELGTVLSNLAFNHITLITLHSDYDATTLAAWKCYSEKVGDDSFQLNWDGTDVPPYVPVWLQRTTA